MRLCTSYLNSQLYSRLLITYDRLLKKKKMKPLNYVVKIVDLLQLAMSMFQLQCISPL